MKNIDVNIFSRFCKEIFDRKFILFLLVKNFLKYWIVVDFLDSKDFNLLFYSKMYFFY